MLNAGCDQEEQIEKDRVVELVRQKDGQRANGQDS